MGGINFAINACPELGVPAAGAFFQGGLGFLVSWLLYSGGMGSFSSPDIAQNYGLYLTVMGAIGYLFPVQLLEQHGINGKQCSEITAVEMMKLQVKLNSTSPCFMSAKA
jgi:hypothetical protein